jgi:class 3 adenylate cyclase
MPDAPETPNGHSDPLVRKLATILSADVAEYSRLMGEDEEGTLRTFRGHKQVFESLVAMHRGRIFNTAGDAILAEFASAVEAVRCATDIQSALRTRNDQLPASRQVRFRIGINLGDVMVQGQDLMGDGVNVAARIQTAAEPGGVCIFRQRARPDSQQTFFVVSFPRRKKLQEYSTTSADVRGVRIRTGTWQYAGGK